MAYVPIPPYPPLLIPGLQPAGPIGSAVTLNFSNASPFQTNWLGVSTNYMGFAAFPELGLSSAQQTAEFDRAYTSGVKMVRTWYGQDWAYASYPAGSADWSSAKMTAFYTWLQAMKDRGINVILTMGWHFPGDVCGISTPTGPACTPSGANETTWKTWVSESLNQIINVRSFTNVIGCFFFTEPNTNGTGTVPGGYANAQDYYIHLVTIARDQIVADDASRTPIRPRILICGAQESAQTNDDWLEYMKANTSSLFDVYTAHSYCITPTFAPLSLSASQCPGYTAWNSLFSGYNTDANPTPYWSDEVNTTTGGDTHSNGYRTTADAGMQLIRWIDGHMQAGAQASFAWMLQDQVWVGSSPYSQQYGVADYIGTGNTVKPSWYAFSMHANLTGGGGGTAVHRCTGGTSTLHGTGVFVPYGVRNAVNASGEWSFVVINESDAAGVTINLASPLSTARTFYRYTYSGEIPPTSATNPAYLLPWDQKFEGITNQIPANVIPGHSVVVFSTMAISNPTAQNLALQASAISDSTGYGAVANVNSGNFSNVLSIYNTWRKADNASHYVQLNWTTVISAARIELAFVGTTAGVVYATYTDTSSPTVLADYTLQYLSLSGVWTNLATVTGNSSPNKTHTFASIQTTAIRLTVTSAAASANVNQIGVYAT